MNTIASRKRISVYVASVFLAAVLLALGMGVPIQRKHPRTTESEQGTGKNYVPGHFIVKFHATLKDRPDRLLEQKRPFAEGLKDRSERLDQLNSRFKVKRARNLLMKNEHLDAAGLKQQWQLDIEKIKAKYPDRTKRASRNAVIPDLSRIYVMEADPMADIEYICRQYRKDPNVEWCAPDYLVKPQWLPNDPYYSSVGSWGESYEDMWALKPDKLNMEAAWDLSQGENVVVAVLDTGVDYNHPDIAENIWTNSGEIPGNGEDDDENGFIDDFYGWNFVLNNGDPMDNGGHGTHVAGIVAAVGNNGIGVVGVAPKAKVMAVNILNNPDGAAGRAAEGLVYAAVNGADILNNSWIMYADSLGEAWGFDTTHFPLVAEAVQLAHALGCVVIFSAGNDSSLDRIMAIHTSEEIINVAASDLNDHQSNYSNYGFSIAVSAPSGGNTDHCRSPLGDTLSLAAPAELLLDDSCALDGFPQTLDGAYRRWSGTSSAAPQVAGLAALIISQRPELSNEQVRSLIVHFADDIEAPGWDVFTGAGRINAYASLANQPPELHFDFPKRYEILNPNDLMVTISGSASAPGFLSYQLFYGLTGIPESWIPVGSPVYSPVLNGTLGTWSTSSLDEGAYAIKLIVTTETGVTFEETTVAYKIDDAGIHVLLMEADHLVQTVTAGNRLFWVEQIYNGLGQITGSALFACNIGTGETPCQKQMVFETDQYSLSFAVSGDRLVWRMRNGNQESAIYTCEYSGLENSCNPSELYQNSMIRSGVAIFGNLIAWNEKDHSNEEPYSRIMVCVLDAQTGACPPHEITGDLLSEVDVAAIDDDLIVWTKQFLDQDSMQTDIFACQLNPLDFSCPEVQITDDESSQFGPKVWGGMITWNDYRDGHEGAIYGCKFNAQTNQCLEERLTFHPGGQEYSNFADGWLTWVDKRNMNFDIYACPVQEISAGCIEQVITIHPRFQTFPQIAGNRVIWRDFRNGHSDIYMADLTADNHPPEWIGANPPAVFGTVGEQVHVVLYASDPDGDPITIFPLDLSPGAEIESWEQEEVTYYKFSWYPTIPGEFTATFGMTDGHYNIPDGSLGLEALTVPITISPFNVAPVFTLQLPGNMRYPHVIRVGQIFAHPIHAFDPDGNAFGICLASGAAGAKIVSPSDPAGVHTQCQFDVNGLVAYPQNGPGPFTFSWTPSAPVPYDFGLITLFAVDDHSAATQGFGYVIVNSPTWPLPCTQVGAAYRCRKAVL